MALLDHAVKLGQANGIVNGALQLANIDVRNIQLANKFQGASDVTRRVKISDLPIPLANLPTVALLTRVLSPQEARQAGVRSHPRPAFAVIGQGSLGDDGGAPDVGQQPLDGLIVVLQLDAVVVVRPGVGTDGHVGHAIQGADGRPLARETVRHPLRCAQKGIHAGREEQNEEKTHPDVA